MRRLILTLILVIIPGLAAAPALVHAHSQSLAARHTPVPEKPVKTKGCSKKPSKKGKSCPPKKKKTPTVRPAAPATRTATPKPTRTSVPTRTAVPTATATSTPTITPSPTATATASATSTPPPAEASMPIKVDVTTGYQAGFFACNLAPGLTVTFDPNPALSTDDDQSPYYASARSTLHVSAAWTVPHTSFVLSLYAYFATGSGLHVSTPPAGPVQPRAVIVTLDARGGATLTPTDQVPAGGTNACSSPPPGYAPTPVPTPAPSEIQVTSWVSDPHPVLNEQVTVYARITGRGFPLRLVPVHFTWFGPYAMPPCDTLTDDSGTASCSALNSHPLPGATVYIQATFTYGGRSYTTYTYFTT